jgi:PhoH-like ATPase
MENEISILKEKNISLTDNIKKILDKHKQKNEETIELLKEKETQIEELKLKNEQLIYENKFDRIVWVRNNWGVKDTKDIGALPGTELEKLMPWVAPLSDHVGGPDGIELLMRQGKLEVQHLGFIRGRDIKNSIIICSEAENLTKQHVQLLIGRVGEGSNLWLDGDFKQTDSKVFEENNGLNIAIDKLKGHPLFGYVHLEESERSETSALADLLD